jgi:NADH:ubiquinone oxidoreductase subunit 3 (subunit A)
VFEALLVIQIIATVVLVVLTGVMLLCDLEVYGRRKKAPFAYGRSEVLDASNKVETSFIVFLLSFLGIPTALGLLLFGIFKAGSLVREAFQESNV